nr:hypothetical protein [Tanacetum cinerariifolium]
DDITPSVARKFLNEVKSTIVTLQRVVRQRMTIETHNWASSAHQEFHKIGKSKDTSSVSDTWNLLSQKLENKNVELEIQVLNYARENAHLKATYKNLFDSISVSRAQTKTIIASLQNELQSNIYKNAKLRTQLFKKVSDQTDNTQDLSANTKFAKQPIVENLPKIGMFRINPSKTSREEKQVPNTVRASARRKPITVSQPNVITKKNVSSDLNGLSFTGLDNTKTRRP